MAYSEKFPDIIVLEKYEIYSTKIWLEGMTVFGAEFENENKVRNDR